jgi:hypothetical protein
MASKLVTDMNSRERAAFIEALIGAKTQIEAAVSALESEDDMELLTAVLLLTVTVPPTIKRLIDVLQSAVSVDTDEQLPPGFRP